MEIKTGKSSAYTTLVTPSGEVTGYSRIFEPSTKFNKSGIYSLDILLSKEDGEEVFKAVKLVQREQITNFRKKEQIQPIQSIAPYTTQNDDGEDIPDPEGRYLLKTRAKANIQDSKIMNKIGVFDAKGRPVKQVNMGAGSIVKLKLDIAGYTVAGKLGVSVRLLAVQILKLVEYQSQANSFAGFGAEEGFEYKEQAAEEEKAAETETEPDEEEDF